MVTDAVDRADVAAAQHVEVLTTEFERNVELLAMALLASAAIVAAALLVHAVTR